MKINRFNESSNKNLPEVGDYVICKIDDILSQIKLTHFIDNKIGKIISIIKKSYIILYENLPEELYIFTYTVDGNGIRFDIDEIIYWSKDKEELELILTTKKFNI